MQYNFFLEQILEVLILFFLVFRKVLQINEISRVIISLNKNINSAISFLFGGP